ncbi:MAG: phosphoribosylformylglycinamidine synthase subunit PurS [Candidatus Dormibacteria bacterium]
MRRWPPRWGCRHGPATTRRRSAGRACKYLEITLDAADEPAARLRLVRMCEELLRNPVIEDYAIASLAPVSAAAL